jgi:hypothetical protein
MSKRIDRLEKTLDEIVELLRQLVSSPPLDHPDPIIPNYPEVPTPLPVPYPAPHIQRDIACNKCGVSFSGITGYVCTDNNCPMGLGPIMCGSE